MAKRPHTTFTPIFQSRRAVATVTGMDGNVITVKFSRKRKPSPLPPFPGGTARRAYA